MIKLTLISPADLTGQDLEWLRIGSKDSIDEISPNEYVDSAFAGNSGLYRISGDADGMVVLTARSRDKLEITALAGRGLIKNFAAVHKEILAAAAATGVKQVCGYTMRAGLAMLYKKHTKAQRAEYFVEDLFT